MKKNFRKLFGCLAVLLLEGCASVPDVPVCSQINPSKGYCVYTISEKDFIWDDEHKFEDKTFWEARPYFVYVPAKSWAEIKKFIIKTCKQHKDCQKDIATWDRKLKKIDEKGQ